jgi:hypothetical protein
MLSCALTHTARQTGLLDRARRTIRDLQALHAHARADRMRSRAA